MKRTNPPLIALLLMLAVSLFTGCSSTRSDSPYADAYERANTRANFLGIVEYEQDSYEPPSPTSVTVRTSDVVACKNISGNKYTFFWNLLTFTDY